jgi:hypothetical protein
LKHYSRIALPWEKTDVPDEPKEYTTVKAAEEGRFDIQTLNLPESDPHHVAWVYDVTENLLIVAPGAHHYQIWTATRPGSPNNFTTKLLSNDELVLGDIYNGRITWSREVNEAVLQYLVRTYDAHFEDKTSKWKRVSVLRGLPQNAIGPHPELQELAQDYMENQGPGYNPPQDYVPVDPNKARQIAQEYEQMQHNPNDPQVKASYEALINETKAQYDHLKKNGYSYEFYPQGQDPYPKGPRQAIEDLRHNQHLYVYPTASGFGQGNENLDHPLLGDSGERWNGQPVTHNDLFRAVHDTFGHATEGVGFRADGEDNAWRQHAAMYSELAKPAMTSETRGQNSWVNFGPHGETNQTADQANTVYAPQKAGLLPEWVHKTAGKDDSPEHRNPGGWSGITQKAKRLLDNGAVNISSNQSDHVTGVVQGDHGTYNTEIWRDDPQSQAITMWNCDCPWSEYSWGRTRKWKKYEGRPCAHTLALFWQSLKQPLDDERPENQAEPQQQLFNPAETQPGTPQPSPFAQPVNPLVEPVQPNVPGHPNPGIIPAPVLPATPVAQPSTIPPPTQQPLPQQQLPFPADPGQDPNAMPVGGPPAAPAQPSHPKGVSEVGPLEFPGTLSSVRVSYFNNGDAVRVKIPLYGTDHEGTEYIIPVNMAGEVLYSDEEETIAIFTINSGPLGPHLVRVEDSTENFYPDPRAQPFIRKRR